MDNLSYRITQTCNASGNALSYLEEIRDNGIWENSSRSINTYDVSGNLLSFLRETWNNGTWQKQIVLRLPMMHPVIY